MSNRPMSDRPMSDGPMSDGPALAIRDATVRLGGRTIFRHLYAEVSAGEFVAVVGPNGAGKSTLLGAVTGSIPLAGGQIRVLGQAPGAAGTQVGYLPQRRSFDASLRVRGVDIVRLGVDGHRWGVPLPGRRSRAATARVGELVHLVGAQGYAHHPIGELSGGEQQRLLIAQALAHRPALLLLDEPLDSLDLPSQAAVAELISSICRGQAVAVVMVTHGVSPIARYLDRVICLEPSGAVAGRP